MSRARVALAAAALALGGCVASKPTEVAQAPAGAPPLVAAFAPVAPAAPITLDGQLVQGGLIFGQAPEGAVRAWLDGAELALTADRRFLIGFDWQAKPTADLRLLFANGSTRDARLRIDARAFPSERINGLPEGMVRQATTLSPAREAELQRVNAARAIRSTEPLWQTAWTWPAAGRMSGVYGAHRILNGEPRNPHRGVDIAAPRGTPVSAPAAGTVVLAEPHLSLEGGTIILDHGQGLFSQYLHLSKVQVSVGQKVAQGQAIGAIGATGRATGPHLHWDVVWNGVRIDPTLIPTLPPFPGERPPALAIVGATPQAVPAGPAVMTLGAR